MYLEIDEGYFEHPKTLRLCAALKDHHAAIYPIRLWKWACRSARDGMLGHVDAFVIEKVVGYEPMDGRCFSAMCAGFLDVSGDDVEIHDWMEYTGGSIKRMEAKAEENRRRREEGKKRHDAARMANGTGDVPESYRNRTSTNPSQTSPDQSRPVQTEIKTCAETGGPSSAPAVLVFPCDGSPNTWALTQPQINEWAKLFPSLPILEQCKAALAWVLAAPDRRKTARGMCRFLVGWFGRQQNGGNGRPQPGQQQARQFDHSMDVVSR